MDPVPFLVVTATAFATCFAFGPAYFTTLGVGIRGALLVSGVAFLGATAASYYRFVWTAGAERRAEVPVASRYRRLVLVVAVGLALVVLLALPLVF